MRQASGRRQVAVSIAAIALGGLLGAWDALAGTTPRTVPLRVGISGSGSVRVTGSPPFICRAKSCNHTFHVLRGRRIAVRALPSRGWKLTKWGGACEHSLTTCSLHLNARRWLTLVFVPPGDHSNPIRPGKAAALAGGWRFKVNSATLDADAEVEAVLDPWTGLPANLPPPAGYQYALVNASMTNVKSPSGNLGGYVKHGIEADGSTSYQVGCIPPPLDLSSVAQVQPGQTATGYLCFEIRSSDAHALMLAGASKIGTTWFALR